MEKFAFLCKTFRNDFKYVKRLLSSFQTFNIQNIKMFIVIPENEKDFFFSIIDKKLLCNTELVFEERFSDYLTNHDVLCNSVPGEWESYPIRPGYINQEIIKLAFHELNLTENYMPIDSDGEFLRSFNLDDFIAEDGYPYTILEEDNELKVDPVYWNEVGWTGREKIIRKIYKEIDYTNRVMITAHGFCIFSSKVLSDFKKHFMNSKGYSYINLMEISSYEFSWYNIWLQKTEIIPIHYREPLFKCFHTKDQLIWYKRQGIQLSDIKRGYVGIVINSNFQPGRGEDNPLDYDTFFDFYSKKDLLLFIKFYTKKIFMKFIYKLKKIIRSI